MDQDALVERLIELSSEFERTFGPLALLMLLGPDTEANDAWNLIVSARGLDTKSRGVAVRELTELLRRNLDEKLLKQISRTTILKTTDPFVHAMNSAFQAERSSVSLTSCNVSGINIPRAFLLESKRVAA